MQQRLHWTSNACVLMSTSSDKTLVFATLAILSSCRHIITEAEKQQGGCWSPNQCIHCKSMRFTRAVPCMRMIINKNWWVPQQKIRSSAFWTDHHSAGASLANMYNTKVNPAESTWKEGLCDSSVQSSHTWSSQSAFFKVCAGWTSCTRTVVQGADLWNQRAKEQMWLMTDGENYWCVVGMTKAQQ